MKELLKLGVYTLLGTLLLSAPFAGLGMLSTHLVTEKTFWIQLIALFLSAVSLQGLWLNPSKGLCPWTYVDILPLSLLGLILLSYPYSIHPEPEKLLFIGQMVVLWYLLRQVFHEYPVLIGYFSMFFIATGLIEAIWGFRQLQGWAYSNHSLFRLTGSFFNPGPYSGYLAITLPVALGILLEQSKRNMPYYLSMGCIGTAIVVLPAGMSRSAWIAVVVSCAWVYALYRLDRKQAATRLRQHKRWYIIGGILGGILLLGGSASLYTLKKDSADGRFLMWKITTKAIQKQPITGTSLGGFPAAYAETQAEYMASGKATEQEKLVAGCQQEYPGVHEAATEADAADAVEALILAVKPHGVLSLISSLSERGEELPLLISIAAAISLDDMEACASDGTRIVRAMPNTPCMVLAGVIAYSTGAAVTDEDEEAARRLLSGCGSVYKVEEARMNAVSAISGSGPAYMFTVLDALSDAGVAMGLSRKTALEMAVETMRGSALMLEQTGKHPMALRDEVTSPGGTTIAALNALDECGFRNAWIQAVKSAVRRAEEMEEH